MSQEKLKKMEIKSSLLGTQLNSIAKKRRIKSQFLTPTSFAYDIVEFKYDNKHNRYELKGIYHEGVREYLSSVGIFKRYINKDKAIIILRIIYILFWWTKLRLSINIA